MEAAQTKCPYCNAASASQSSGQYVCDFCLQSFTVAEARNEETRLLDELKTWVQKLGVGPASSSVDSSSRAYIFQQKVFPELRRDVSRLLETIGAHGQYPLVVAPVPSSRPSAGPNPLLSSIRLAPTLKMLIARCESADVLSFAVTDEDRTSVTALASRLSETLHLFHIARAGATPTADGYAAARRNIELMLGSTLAASARPGIAAGERSFLIALAARYRSLVEACRLFGELAGGESAIGNVDRVEALATAMDAAARDLEESNWLPAESMPLVLGIREEAQGARSTAKWLRGYEVFSSRSNVSFTGFIVEMQAVAGASAKAEDLLESYAYAFQAARGEVAATAVDDFQWVAAWSEGKRSRKTLGLFGTNEEIAQVEQFLMPVWLAEVSFSRSSGKVFKSGSEAKAIAIVDACSPSSAKVCVFVEGHAQLAAAMSSPRSIGGQQLALPNSSAATAKKVIVDGLKQHPDLLNSSVQLKGMVFLPAVVVHYSSKAGTREATTCLADTVPIDDSARIQWQQARSLMERFA